MMNRFRSSRHQIKKAAALALALGAMGVAGTSQAVTAFGTFDVNITLTSVCTMSAITPVSFTYTSGTGAGPVTQGTYSITCTSGLPFNVALQAGTGGAYPGVSASINVTDGPTQIQYTLNTTGPTANLGGTGTGLVQNYVIDAVVPASQWGCAGGACAQPVNNTHTLWVNY